MKKQIKKALQKIYAVDYTDLETALKDGCKLHAFSSGGRLRVVTLEKEKAKGYGEHPTLEEAIRHAVEDYKAGGRPYKEVYGKLYDHYMTGAYPANEGNITVMDLLDRHVFRGSPLDVSSKEGKIVVELTNTCHLETPPEVMARAFVGETVKWSMYGKSYVTSPFQFPNGAWGCSTSPGGESVTIVKRGEHETFLGAVTAAIENVGFIKEYIKVSKLEKRINAPIR